MRLTTLVERMVQLYGKDNVRICTEFHVQVTYPVGHVHNIWVNKFGKLSWRLERAKRGTEGRLAKLEEQLNRYNPNESDYARSLVARELTTFIGQAHEIANLLDLNYCVFCDASIRNGQTRIACIAIVRETVSAHITCVDTSNIQEAERLAILQAYQHFGRLELPILNDNQQAVESVNNDPNLLLNCKVIWVPRTKNENADQLLRIKEMLHGRN